MSLGLTNGEIESLVLEKILYDAFYIIQARDKFFGNYIYIDGNPSNEKIEFSGNGNTQYSVTYYCNEVVLKKGFVMMETIFDRERTERKKRVYQYSLKIYGEGRRLR